MSRASRHQSDQAGLVRLMHRELFGLWPNLLLLGVPVLLEVVGALVVQYARASSALAVEFYLTERETAGARARLTLPVAEPPPTDQVDASLSWATWPLRQDATPQRVAVARQRVDGATQRLVVNTGRRTLVEATTADTAALGWARVPTGERTCHFCAMLCTRGAVYKSEATAGRGANARFVGEGEFKFHDSDDCAILPIFLGQEYQPSEQVQRWEQLYA
ncbi:MAG: hypothetical protein LC799_18370, partial [Actinobacteria bacterium]|nr:hypothetical protein [Actinomycetota bacterium]